MFSFYKCFFIFDLGILIYIKMVFRFKHFVILFDSIY